MRKRRKPPTPETIIKRNVKKYLLWRKWFVFSVLQGLGAYPGISDMIAVKGGFVLFIELKTPTGKQSDDQIEFERLVREHGGEYLIIRSLDEIEEVEKHYQSLIDHRTRGERE